MKIQGLAIISIIIILPISILLSSYTSNQMKTIQLQNDYDSRLMTATHDAIKAFQLNMTNSSTSSMSNSKMRDIKASVNSFYNSLESQFNMEGYGQNVMEDYIPAIVYTLYDGYYIYSAYDNDLNELTEEEKNKLEGRDYEIGETIHGLKPYVYYSCRYKPNNDSDFVITYTLDSYITIQGIIGGTSVNKSGYLLSGVTSANGSKYRGISIEEESNIQQYVYVNDTAYGSGELDNNFRTVEINDEDGYSQVVGGTGKFYYKKINGAKYYSGSDEKVFTIINDVADSQTKKAEDITKNTQARDFYKKAYEFTNYVGNDSTLKELKVGDAVDLNGNHYEESNNPFSMSLDEKIFKEIADHDYNKGEHYIEDVDSDFYTYKTAVIKNSIETNLIAAISKYKEASSIEINFSMPKLRDYEWEQLTHNVAMITFMQGLSIGGKIYNGYSIVNNDKTEDYVSENSIYIIANDDQYHKPTETGLENIINGNSIGIFATDVERRTAKASYEIPNTDTDGNPQEITKRIFYYPRNEQASYNSIVNPNNVTIVNNIYKYMQDKGGTLAGKTLATKYFTALGRERYSLYRIQEFEQ